MAQTVRRAVSAYGKFVQLTDSHVRGVMEVIKESQNYSASQLYNVAKLYTENLQSRRVTTKFFAYNGFIDDLDEACIVAVQYRNFYAKEMLTMSAPFKKFVSKGMASEFSQLIDWKSPFINAYVPQRFVFDAGLQQVVCQQEFRRSRLLVTPKEVMEDTKVLLKSPWTFRKLRVEDAHLIAKRWKDQSRGALKFLQDSLETVDSLGIFGGDDGELVSTTVMGNHGICIALMTSPECRGLGLGTKVYVKNLQLSLATQLMPNGATDYDSVSAKIHAKIGLPSSNDLFTIFPAMGS